MIAIANKLVLRLIYAEDRRRRSRRALYLRRFSYPIADNLNRISQKSYKLIIDVDPHDGYFRTVAAGRLRTIMARVLCDKTRG